MTDYAHVTGANHVHWQGYWDSGRSVPTDRVPMSLMESWRAGAVNIGSQEPMSRWCTCMWTSAPRATTSCVPPPESGSGCHGPTSPVPLAWSAGKRRFASQRGHSDGKGRLEVPDGTRQRQRLEVLRHT